MAANFNTLLLADVELRDKDDLLVANVRRRRTDDLDYVAITRHDDVITVAIDQVPELIEALTRAMNAR